jgi:hypothetical protein
LTMDVNQIIGYRNENGNFNNWGKIQKILRKPLIKGLNQ